MSRVTLKILKKFLRVKNPVNYVTAGFCNARVDRNKYYRNVEEMPTKYGGKSNITVLPGIGIGPEIMESTLKILEAAEAPLECEIIDLKEGDELEEEFQHVLISIRRNRIAIKGNIEVQSSDPLITSRNVALRKTLDLFVYVVPCKTFPGLQNKFGEIDVVLIRQNTEGEYLMLEHEPIPGVAESLKIVTRYNSERLAEYAFKYAIEHKRKLVTVVHSADVQPLSEGLFVEGALNVSKKYPGIKVNVMEVGVATTQMFRDPKEFDMILATNLNGSMMMNFLSGMIGGPAMSAGTNLAEDGIAVFEPGVRNKGSSIVNQGKANPVAMMLASVAALKHLGHTECAENIYSAIYKTLVFDQVHTPDLGGKATTTDVTNNVLRHVRQSIGYERKQQKSQNYERIRLACAELENPSKPKCPNEC